MGSVKTASAAPGRLGVDRFSVILVAVAATMWASDAYFRNQLVQHLSATQIVVAEDALVTLFLLPVLIRSRASFRPRAAGMDGGGDHRGRRAGAGDDPVHRVVLVASTRSSPRRSCCSRRNH